MKKFDVTNKIQVVTIVKKYKLKTISRALKLGSYCGFRDVRLKCNIKSRKDCFICQKLFQDSDEIFISFWENHKNEIACLDCAKKYS